MQTKILVTLFSSILTVLLLYNCKNNDSDKTEIASPGMDTNVVIFTPDQIRLANIKTDKIEKHSISNTVECTGRIEAHPNAIASVSAPIGGFIKNAPFYQGNYVKKGTILAVLEHPDYIRLQQDYLETKNKLEYYKEEFKRQGELTVENASSIKKMQQAQADYRTTEVKLFSLKAQLKLIGINADSLNIESISTTINITSPISGYISKVNASIGKFADSNEIIYEIVNNNNLHLHLKIFEKDIHKIKKGQKVIFGLMNSHEKKYSATIISIGQKVDDKSNTFSLHADIKNKNPVFNPGMHVFAEILLSATAVYAVPSEAVVTKKNKNFLFIAKDTLYYKIQIKTGKESKGYIELVNLADSILEKQIVTSGAYYLNAELEKEE